MSDDLENHVRSIAKTIEQGLNSEENEGQQMDGLEYLANMLDIEYIVASDRKTLLGARVLVAFGGPNIWINTRTKQVEGYWWADCYIASYDEDNIGLNECIECIWEC